MSKIKKIEYSANAAINRRLMSDSKVILVVPYLSLASLYSKEVRHQIFSYGQVIEDALLGYQPDTVIIKPRHGDGGIRLASVMYRLGRHGFNVDFCGYTND